jgi:hypothetical protein
MTSQFPYEQTRALLLEFFQTHEQGQYVEAVAGVANLAAQKGLIQGAGNDGRSIESLAHHERHRLQEQIRQTFWQLLVQEILVFGLNDMNANWPWYRLTEYGQDVVKGQGAQPYDPDNFLQEFQRENRDADPVIVDYLDEALRAFNHGCQKSAAVMIGAASEKALLLLLEAFEAAITDQGKRERFRKSYRWTISSKVQALKEGLAKNLPRDMEEAASNALQGLSERIRRVRNEAGHPEIFATPHPDANFLTLRVFTEYTRNVYLLIEHLKRNSVNV